MNLGPGFPITPTAFEFSDGLLIIFLAIMLFFAVIHLFSIWNDCRTRFPGKWGAFRCIRGIYYERKPSVAIVVIIGALFIRFVNLWHLRHVTNHHLPQDAFTIHSFSTFVVAYVLLIWGVICWIRNISPFRVYNWEWVLILSISVMLAYYWAN